ncbi:prephenate dehydratase [Nocardioidaceae bacterium]|nr:prephenate dehydratase [Nocardioidaceae bacterium]
MSRLAYLGPSGTFTEQALLARPEAVGAELVACPTVPAALDLVREGTADAAMVAIESSVEGGVSVTLDELATGTPLVIVGEVEVPVTFCLVAPEGVGPEQVRTVGAHPHAAAQVRRWVAANLPDATVVDAPSNAASASALVDGTATWDAGIAAPLAAERYELTVLAAGIADTAGAVTRFVLVAPPGSATVPARTGADKTSLVVFPGEDRPGLLLEILESFALRGVNMVRIESRPTGEGLGNYCFSIDAEGHLEDARVAETLMSLHRTSAEVRFLGSYPRAAGGAAGPGSPGSPAPTSVPPGHADEDFAAARAWLDGLRPSR